MPAASPSVAAAIRAALLTPDPRAKVMAARRVARDWRLGRLGFAMDVAMPDRPARPDRPVLLPPRDMPRRGQGSASGRIALWHAVAHIEFVAIDLALDAAGRFGGELGAGFVGDSLAVAADEALHFALLNRHLRALGSHYGALPAHDGLWEAAHATRHDAAARLAVVPMALEARGLDATPRLVQQARSVGDRRGARILSRILADEIRHVRLGAGHFYALCATQGVVDGDSHWRALIYQHASGVLKPPFNDSARQTAGLPRGLYHGVAS